MQSIDLGEPNEENYTQLLSKTAGNIPYDLYLLVHNAGSIIVDTPAAQMTDVNRWNA